MGAVPTECRRVPDTLEEHTSLSNLLLTTETTKQVSEFGDPSVLKPVPSPLPTCSPGEVLVSMRAAGVNPVETYIRSGKYAKLPTLPFTPGEHIPQGFTVCEKAPSCTHAHISPPPLHLLHLVLCTA